MRIVMITGSLSRQAGGLFWSVRRLSQSLAHAGAEVHVLGLRDSATAEDLAAWQPLAPCVFDPVMPTRLGYVPRLGHEIVKLAPDIVHLHGIWQGLSVQTARWAARGGAVMISPRGMLDPWAMANAQLKKRVASYERANLNRATCLHALNVSEAAAIRSILPKAAIATIPNGIDVPDVTQQRSTPADGRPRLLFISRVHPKKGLMTFLDQWAAVQPRLTRPWVLRIAGPDGAGHTAALQARVAELGLSESVAFIGPVYGDDKACELAEAEAFVLPSQSEGLPMAVLEAWASGLPVLMTRACNLPEGFVAGAAIKLDDNAEQLFVGLEQTDLAKMGARGRALAKDRFGWDSIVARHLTVYEWMVNNPSQLQCSTEMEKF